ncbi:MAG: SdrD B-like domain-containing protein, partial [Chloroflexota bacterium]
MSITIFSSNSFQLDNATWSDNLIGVQPGIHLATPVNLSNTCGGTATAVAGGTTVSLSGGTVPAQSGVTPGSCTVAVDVTSTTPGNLVNTIPAGGLTATANGGVDNITNTTPASATLSVSTVQAPAINKNFNPTTVWAGQVSQLTINVINNDTNNDLTQISLSDSLPANFVVATPPAATLTGTGCTGTFNPLAGDTVLNLTNATAPKSITCVLRVNVISLVTGAYTNTIPIGAISSKEGVTNAAAASANINVQVSATMAKTFTPASIVAGGISSLAIVINNPTGIALTGATFTDTLPAGLTIASAPVASQCNGGNVSSTANSVTLTGGTIPALSSCTITVSVTAPMSTNAGTYTNTIPVNALNTTQGARNSNAVNTNLTVQAISLIKSFGASPIAPGSTSLLTITLQNPTGTAYTGVAVNDTLPGGLTIAAAPAPVNNCGGSLTAASGTALISLSGGTVPASATPPTLNTCTIVVPVLAAMNLSTATLTNTIPVNALTTTEGARNVTPASAPLSITSISLTKNFAPLTIVAGATSTLTITLQNPSGNPITGVTFTDTLPAGLVIANPPASTNSCGGALTAAAGAGTIGLTGGTIPASATPPTPNTCVITVSITAPLSTSSGTYTNNIPANAIITTQGASNANGASVGLTVNSAGVSKAFAPASFPAGGTSVLTITLTNPTASAYTSVGITDTLPAVPNTNLSVVLGSGATTCAGGSVTTTAPRTVALTGGSIPAGGSCTVTVTVTAPAGSSAASYDNNIPSNALITFQGVTNPNPVTAAVNVTAVGGPPTLTKAFQTNPIAPYQNTRLRLTIVAPTDTSLTGFSITDPLPAGMYITNSTPATKNAACAGGTLTATTGANTISWTGGTIAAAASCQITVYVSSATAGTVANTINPVNITDNEGRTIAAPVSANLTVTSNLPISKAFFPDTVAPNGLSRLTITLQNTNPLPLVNGSLTDNLNTAGTTTNGVILAPSPNPSTTCGGIPVYTLTAPQLFNVTGFTIPAQVGGVPGLCTFSFDVQGKGIATTHTNTIPLANVTATVQGTGISMNATANATAPLVITPLAINVVKGFNPLTVTGGSSSTLSVQLTNPNTAVLTGVALIDTMPVGMIIANPANLNTGTCGGVLTGVPGAASFSFSGGTLPAATTCTLTLSITMTVNGNLTNTIPAGGVTTFNGASNSQPASASLTNLPGASVSKFFSPNPVLAGSANYSLLTITIQNTSNFALTGMGLTDNLPGVLPAGLEIAGAPAPTPTTTCGGALTASSGTQNIQLVGGSLGGNAACTIVVPVTSNTPGSYLNNIPAGALATTQGATNNQPASDTLVVAASASLGDFVWNDLNANGIQDAGEAGIPNVSVELFNAAGVSQGTTTTNASGAYNFTGLTPGDYYVVFTVPAGYTLSPQDQGVNDAVDSDANPLTGRTATTTLTAGENDLTWDAGLYQKASLGDFVWNDLNANGIQDAGETGIANVGVELFNAAGVSQGTTTTNASGAYSFAGLTPGDYYVVFTAPAGYTISPQDQGANDAVDSDANPLTGRTATTTLTAGENDLTWDAGLNQNALLGDFVWNDLNANGIQDAGETGIANVGVELFNAAGVSQGTTTTNASGAYSFAGLTPGDYYVVFTAPAGYTISPQDQGANDAVDSDANPLTGRTATTTLTAGENDLTWDAGLNQNALLGDFVWNDLNANGIQ